VKGRKENFLKPSLRIAALSLSLAWFATGCATDRHEQTFAPVWSLSEDDRLFSTTNIVSCSSYELQIYVICAGDSVAKIAKQFHTSMADIMAFNPGLNPRNLKIGKKLLVAEHEVK
jgi:LysM domain